MTTHVIWNGEKVELEHGSAKWWEWQYEQERDKRWQLEKDIREEQESTRQTRIHCRKIIKWLKKDIAQAEMNARLAWLVTTVAVILSALSFVI